MPSYRRSYSWVQVGLPNPYFAVDLSPITPSPSSTPPYIYNPNLYNQGTSNRPPKYY